MPQETQKPISLAKSEEVMLIGPRLGLVLDPGRSSAVCADDIVRLSHAPDEKPEDPRITEVVYTRKPERATFKYDSSAQLDLAKRLAEAVHGEIVWTRKPFEDKDGEFEVAHPPDVDFFMVLNGAGFFVIGLDDEFWDEF